MCRDREIILNAVKQNSGALSWASVLEVLDLTSRAIVEGLEEDMLVDFEEWGRVTETQPDVTLLRLSAKKGAT